MYELFKHMPYGVAHDEETVLLRDGAICKAFEVKGINADTSNDVDILTLRRRVSHLLNGFDERFSFYVHRYRRSARITGFTKPTVEFAKALDDVWFEALEQSDPKETVVVLTIVRRNMGAVKVPVLGAFTKKIGQMNLEGRAAELRETAASFKESLGVSMTPLTVSDGRFGSAMAVLNFQQYEAIPRGMLTLIAQDVSAVDLEIGADGVVEINEGEAYGAVLSVKEYPVKTKPGVLDALDAMDDIVVVQSYSPVHRDEIAEQARLRLAQMQASEDMANRIAQQLLDTADRIEAGELGVGEHSLTILIRAESLADLEDRISSTVSICQMAGFRMMRDKSVAATEAFACHPGNQKMHSRSMYVSSETFADLSCLHGVDIGPEFGNMPWVEPVTIFETEQGAPYRFSFHAEGSPDAEPTNCHTLVLGPSSGGKTTTTLFLAAQAMRFGARIIALDKLRGMEMALRALGGTYSSVQVGEPTGLNPLMTEDGPRGEAWLMQWFSSLLENTGAPLTPRQSKVLRSAIRQNSEAPAHLRKFSRFVTLIGDADDNGDLGLRVREWGPDGRYSWVFGDNENVLVDFNKADVTGVDLTEVLKLGTERTAILGYLFRSLERVMEERRPLILLIDEAWQVLDDPYFAKMLEEWLVTVRKQQAVVIAMTQFPSQIEKSASSSILEGLPNQLIFPNEKATAESYESLGLSDGELDFVLSTAAGQRRALFRSDQASTILDVDLSRLGDLLSVIGGGITGVAKFGADFATKPDFWKRAPEQAAIIDLKRKSATHA